jgi:hypothetical protein
MLVGVAELSDERGNRRGSGSKSPVLLYELMPAKTEKQRKMMGADLRRKREGKKTRTGLSEKKLREFAKK